MLYDSDKTGECKDSNTQGSSDSVDMSECGKFTYFTLTKSWLPFTLHRLAFIFLGKMA